MGYREIRRIKRQIAEIEALRMEIMKYEAVMRALESISRKIDQKIKQMS